ncbi:hypothetical protein KUV23_06145 [Algoriphagus marincola]|uniref:Paraquat-inducible protein A n=1 Tax=Algoriphagus marincola TaxID=264027 RepID=A0ABS7N3G1_9BACT|nr:hypothetical protein [Algoriphagus marincola]MBY5950545.1 hypothetical protein [Algoriphagus marincola]
MGYLLKILIVLLATLIVLGISLIVVALLAWDINSKMVLPEMLKSADFLHLVGDEIGTYLEVLTGIVALLYPISLSIISDAKGDYFNSEEVTTVVFKHWTYKALKWILGLLVFLTVLSFFKIENQILLFVILLVMTISLTFLFLFFKRLEKVIRDFADLVRKEEKSNIQKILRDGQN